MAMSDPREPSAPPAPTAPTAPPPAYSEICPLSNRPPVARAGWSVTKTLKNIEYTHKWEIEDFDLAWGLGEGRVQSKTFSIPGVEGFFHLELALKREKVSNGFKIPKNIRIGEQTLKPKAYFSISLKSSIQETKAAGKVDIIKEGAETLSGSFGDPPSHSFDCGPEQLFLPNIEPRFEEDYGFQSGSGFYTTGRTALLILVVEITIAGKVINMGGELEEERDDTKQGVLDLKPFLSNRKHSDVLLKSADATFPCHKVVLSARWGDFF